MAFSISDFRSALDRGNSLLKQANFELSIVGMPAWAAGKYDMSALRFMCNATQLPGIDIEAVTTRRYGTGLQEYFPTGVVFDDLRTTFYVPQDAQIIKFFNDWSKNIVHYDPHDTTNQRFRVHYRSNYVARVQIIQYDTEGEPILTYTFRDAFPVRLPSVDVQWYAKDAVMEYPVTWKYLSWTEASIAQPTSSRIENGLPVSMPSTGIPGYTDNLDSATTSVAPLPGSTGSSVLVQPEPALDSFDPMTMIEFF